MIDDLNAAVSEAFAQVLKDHVGWYSFSSKFKMGTGPLFSIAGRNVSNNKAKILQLVSKTMLVVLGTTDTVLGIKEAVKVKDDLASYVVKRLKPTSTSTSSLTSSSTSKTAQIANQCHEVLADKFGDMFVDKLSTVASGGFTATMRGFAMAKVHQKMTTLSKMHNQEGYFRQKRHEHKQFLTEKHGDFKASEKSVDAIISEKKDKPADATDLVALDTKLGKKIVVDTYDENGTKIKSDSSKGDHKEELRLRLTKVKNDDGSYSGHYELVHDGKVIRNQGEANTCLYQAVCQAERGYESTAELKMDAEKLKDSALRGLDEKLFQSLHAREDSYKAKNGSCDKFNLSGGGGGKSSFDKNRPVQIKDYDDVVRELALYFEEDGVSREEVKEALGEVSKRSERDFKTKYIKHDHPRIAGETHNRIHTIADQKHNISVSFPRGDGAAGTLRASFRRGPDGKYGLWGYTREHNYDNMAATKRAFKNELFRDNGILKKKKK